MSRLPARLLCFLENAPRPIAFLLDIRTQRVPSIWCEADFLSTMRGACEIGYG